MQIFSLIYSPGHFDLRKPMLIHKIIKHMHNFYNLSFFEKSMSNQKQIDDLLNDSLLASSSANVPSNIISQSRGKQQYGDSYANQDFQDYDESRQTNGMRHSRSEIEESKQMKKKAKLSEIRQEPPSTINANKNARKANHEINQFKTQQNFKNVHNKQQTSSFPDKIHLPHNYARLQDREREQLITTISQQNRQLKAEMQNKGNDMRVLQSKYKMLLEEKSHHNSSAKQMALQKKVSVLEEKLKKMENLKKIQQQKNKFSTKISNKPHNFIPEEEADRRETQLLQMIDKLKERLIHSDENMTVLQKKIHQHVDHNDELIRKMKRVEQLEYRIDKMTAQAETDRSYIQLLKEKIKQLQQKVEKEKNKYSKQQVEIKRLQMGQFTHSDIMQQLKETRREKEMLEKSLKQLSSAMISNVRKGNKKRQDPIQDSNDLLKCSQ